MHLSKDPIFNGEPKLEVSTAFVKVKDKYLLLKRAEVEEQGMKWGIPGGKVEFGETSLEGLKREISEETGINVGDNECINIGSFYAHHTKYYYKLHIFLVDLGDADVPEVNLNPSEHSGFVWTSLSSMEDYPLILGQGEIIREMKSSLE